MKKSDKRIVMKSAVKSAAGVADLNKYYERESVADFIEYAGHPADEAIPEGVDESQIKCVYTNYDWEFDYDLDPLLVAEYKSVMELNDGRFIVIPEYLYGEPHEESIDDIISGIEGYLNG